MTQDISDEAVERILDQLQGEGHAYIAKLVINHGSTGYIMLAASDTIRALYARLKDKQIQNKSLSLAQETHLALIAELDADITTLSARLKEAEVKLAIACEKLVERRKRVQDLIDQPEKERTDEK